MKYDVVIIGAGPAGLTAGLYAVRSGLKTCVVSKDIGGTANSILMLDNWPGFSGKGVDLMKQFYEQLKKYDVDFIMGDVNKIEKKGEEFSVNVGKQEIESKVMILATGTERRKLKIPGEEKFKGKGVSYCVTCDAFFFKDKIVAVIGGSDCAATSALALTDLAKKVYVIYRGEKLRCEDINSKRLEKKKNVEIIYNSIPREIKGGTKVESFILEDGKEISVDGIFIEIGSVALTKIFNNLGLKLDKEKYIVVDEKMATSVEGIFAAGDVTNFKLNQIVVAASQGAIAAKSAYEQIKERK